MPLIVGLNVDRSRYHLGDVNDLHLYTDPRDVPAWPHQYGMVGEYSNVASYVPGHEWQPGRCHAMKAQVRLNPRMFRSPLGRTLG